MSELDDILARHKPYHNDGRDWCYADGGKPWPCDAYRAATEAVRLRDALLRLVESVQTLETVDDDGEAADYWTLPPEPLELAHAAIAELRRP